MIPNESMDSGKFRAVVLLSRLMFLDNGDENEKMSPLIPTKDDLEHSINDDVNEPIAVQMK